MRMATRGVVDDRFLPVHPKLPAPDPQPTDGNLLRYGYTRCLPVEAKNHADRQDASVKRPVAWSLR